MFSSRQFINGLIFALINANAVTCFYEDKQQEDYTTANLNITFCDALKKNCHSKLGQGRYGHHSPSEHSSGWLVVLNEDNRRGCKEFSRKVSPDLKPWIALISRGECNFKEKIENAYKHNASAVIIYNDRNSDEEVTMTHDGADNIVSVSVTQFLGENLVSKLHNATVYVQITEGRRYRTKWQVNPTSVLFVSVSFIVLMVISLAWLVFYYVQRFRYVHARDKTEKRLTSAAKKAIAKLPVRTVSRRDEPDESDSCAVCLDGYKGGEQLRILPCNHEFHKGCIDPWLIEHRTCPMCKLNILKELGVTNQSGNRQRDPEVAFVESPEDHGSANDNPLADLSDLNSRHSRHHSQDSSSDGSIGNAARVVHVNADLNWERESSSTSNLVENSCHRT